MTNEEYEAQVGELTIEIKEAREKVDRHHLDLIEAERLHVYWETIAYSAQEELDELMERFEEDSNNDA